MGAAARKIEPETAENAVRLLNTTQLEFRFGVNRVTIAKRLREAGIFPAEARAKEKLYAVNDELIACIRGADQKIDEIKRRGEEAKARLAEIKVEREEGDLVPMAECVEIIQQLFSAVHKEIAVRMPREIAGRLAKAKTKAEAQKAIKTATDRRFSALRDDFEKFLK